MKLEKYSRHRYRRALQTVGSEFGLYPNGSRSFKQQSGLNRFALERWVWLQRGEGTVGRKARVKEGSPGSSVWCPKQEMMVGWERIIDVRVENKRN